jgi:hypothetical protein
MDLRDKVITVLSASFPVDYYRLEIGDGITGFVVSPRFQGMPSLDRQALIDQALREASRPLSPEEQRQVLMIAGLTPAEYDVVGAKVQVSRVKELTGGAVEVVVHGRLSDAAYIRGVFKAQKGIQTTEPKPVPNAPGLLMSFRAKGSATSPLTKTKVLRLLNRDLYVEVMTDA